MRCERCGMELMGGRGAYHWRSEVAAIGDDVLSSTEIDLDLEKYRRRLFEEFMPPLPAGIGEVAGAIFKVKVGNIAH